MASITGFSTGKRYKFTSVEEGIQEGTFSSAGYTLALGGAKRAWRVHMNKPLCSGGDWFNYHVQAEQAAKKFIRERYKLPKEMKLYADCHLDEPNIDVWIPEK